MTEQFEIWCPICRKLITRLDVDYNFEEKNNFFKCDRCKTSVVFANVAVLYSIKMKEKLKN